MLCLSLCSFLYFEFNDCLKLDLKRNEHPVVKVSGMALFILQSWAITPFNLCMPSFLSQRNSSLTQDHHSFHLIPNHGIMAATSEKLFVRRIEENARLIPTNIFARVPLRGWEENGYRSITWKQYDDGINKIAHWLDKTLGKSTDNDTVSYFGANDIRYAFVHAALNKSNRKVLHHPFRLSLENTLTRGGVASHT